MKVLFLTRSFYPNIGGVEKHVLLLSRELLRRGYKITIICEKSDSKDLNYELFEDIEIYRIPKLFKNKKINNWYYLFGKFNLLKNANIVHCHDVFYWYLPFKFLLPFKKVYTTFHGYEGDNIPTKRAIFMHQMSEKLSNGSICIGDFLKKWYKHHPTFVSYGATALKKSNSAQKLNKNNLRAVFVGRLENETGILEYLETVVKLKKNDYKIKLLVLGDGTQRKQAVDYSKLNKLAVTFKGFVRDPEIFLKKSDIIFVSRYLGILEALAIGKIVYALYNNEIKKDYLIDTPFRDYIQIASSSEELSKKVIWDLKSQDEVKKRLQKGYRWASLQTWEKLTDTYETLWNK